MNVLFLTNSIGYGGAEKMMNFVTDVLVNYNYSVTIYNLNSVSSDISQQKQIFNPKVKVVTQFKVSSNRNYQSIKNIVSIIKNDNIDMIISFTMFPNFYATIASIITGVPSIVSERGDPFRTFTNSFKDKIMRFVINKSKGAVFQTKEASLFYSNKLQKRGLVIPNPIFTNGEHFPSIEAKDRTKSVVSVGRFQNVQKRMDVLLRAFKIFSAKHPDYILKMYGSGEVDYVKSLIKQLDICDKVKLLGTIRNPMSKIFKEGMFVITSDYEGIPNALLEAMAVGLPVISTDCSPGGAKLLIQNRENGLLVPKGDYNAVAMAMSEFAEDYTFADKCGNNAKNVSERFAPQVIGKAWINYINKIYQGTKCFK